MADQTFVVGYQGVQQSHGLTVEASKVEKEGTCWKISGEKGVLWISEAAFLYAYPSSMLVEKAR
jgi:hypothetical protein